jgi:hypothetical protein
VIVVLGFAQPAALAEGLAGGATLRLETELLMPTIAQIGIEQLFAMQTLSLIRLGHPR